VKTATTDTTATVKTATAAATTTTTAGGQSRTPHNQHREQHEDVAILVVQHGLHLYL
jgi:hypothetical protein